MVEVYMFPGDSVNNIYLCNFSFGYRDVANLVLVTKFNAIEFSNE